MTLLPAGVKVHLAFGYTDMRKGMDGLAALVQEVLHQDPFTGHLFVFRGRKANLIKIVFWDGTGLCGPQLLMAMGSDRTNSLEWGRAPAFSYDPVSQTCS